MERSGKSTHYVYKSRKKEYNRGGHKLHENTDQKVIRKVHFRRKIKTLGDTGVTKVN